MAEATVVADAEVDREIIPGAAFGNRVIEVARVSLNQIKMHATNADFDYRSLSDFINVSPVRSHQTRQVTSAFK